MHTALHTQAGVIFTRRRCRNNECRRREQIFLIGIRIFLMAEGKDIETWFLTSHLGAAWRSQMYGMLRRMGTTFHPHRKPNMGFMLFLASWWPGSEMAGSSWLVHSKSVLLGCPSVLLSHLLFIPLSFLDRVYFDTNVAPYHISFCHVRFLCWRAFRGLFVSSTSTWNSVELNFCCL